MTNKEAIEKLVKYFREHSDFETVSRALANHMIDNNRMLNFYKLPKEERDCLKLRMEKNGESFKKFFIDGDQSDFLLVNLTAKDENGL